MTDAAHRKPNFITEFTNEDLLELKELLVLQRLMN